MLFLAIRCQLAVNDRLLISFILPKCRKLFIIIENRVRIILLFFQIQPLIIWIDPQPRCPRRKSGVFAVIPLKRSPGMIM